MNIILSPLENKKLNNWRNQKNYSQTSLAEKLGIARSTYIGYEKQGRMPTAYVVLQLSRLLDIPINEVYESFEMSDGYVHLTDVPELENKEEALVNAY